MTASKHHDAHQHENNNEDLRERNLALLASYALRRDPRQRNRLVELNLPLVRKIAHQESLRTDLPFEDLVQEGALGLIRAVEAFDPARPTALSSFAVPYIQGQPSMCCFFSLYGGASDVHPSPLSAGSDRSILPSPQGQAIAVGGSTNRWGKDGVDRRDGALEPGHGPALDGDLPPSRDRLSDRRGHPAPHRPSTRAGHRRQKTRLDRAGHRRHGAHHHPEIGPTSPWRPIYRC